MKKLSLLILFISIILLASCKKEEDEIITIIDTGYVFSETIGEKIPISNITIPYSKTKGNLDNFINIHKPKDINPIVFSDSSIKTHQVILTLEHIYPIESLHIFNPDHKDAYAIKDIDIDISINELSYTRIHQDYKLNNNDNVINLGGQMVKSIKFTFDQSEENQALTDVSFKLADGFIIKFDHEMSDAFLRYNGWTGADGIFSFDLDHGGDEIGKAHDVTGFVFSDTFVGEVYENNKLRKSSAMINNSFGYLSHKLSFDRNQFTFDYKMVDNKPKSVIIPDELIGSRARNLLDSDGLTASYHKSGLLTNLNEGTMWLSDQVDNELIIDLKSVTNLEEILLWNFNETAKYGVKTFNLYVSDNHVDYNLIDQFEINQAMAQVNEPYTLEIKLDNLLTRYIKIEVIKGYDTNFVGLGKILLLGPDDKPLFGTISAKHEITDTTQNEKTSRYWIQDGVVIDNHLYAFPILVKDDADIFKVHHVALTEIPIIDKKFAYEQTNYLSTPLQTHTPDGGVIYYGAGLMDNRHIDNYIYIYGYKDLSGRGLVVARFKAEDIKDFNKWTYYDGQGWSSDINDSYPLINKVSAELSVTHMPTGIYKDKYMLVVMENTTSGIISYSISDTPYGPFNDYQKIFQTTEGSNLRDAFTYNAKLHPNLSHDKDFVISYNVNTRTAGALSDARIYYPRFIRMIEVNKKD